MVFKTLSLKQFFAFILLFYACIGLGNAQSRVNVIASVHNSTKYITKDTLLKALNDFKPDIILLELDTSLMSADGDFQMKPERMSLESQTAQAYKQMHPQTLLRGIDVVYRNRFYREHDTFIRENKMGKLIDSLYKNNMLNDTSWFIVNSLYSSTQIINNFGYMQLKDINSAICMQAAFVRQNLLYSRELEVIRNNKDLKTWYLFAKENADFWTLRNKTMVANTLAYIKKYPGKNIAVIVGYFHKYALTDGLAHAAGKKMFVLVN